MKIILLSGGSGERLWPLSNDERSKQFLSLLQAPDGRTESMVQRVVRQISEAGLGKDILVATNEMQTRIIREQLGNSVDIVTEPQRRNTFPAIALASEYLASTGCGADETVVVMPCDPYTEAGYFDVIGRMAEAVEKDAAELVLMGIKPTYPSPKYGYVVPQEGDKGKDIEKVCQFTEKPDIAGAKALLERGALWNGGVFAFKLGYVTALARKYVSGSFEQVRAAYEQYPKISFDYEVAEKAQSVAVIPFDGKWKDLGTWNTLSEELPSETMGRVVTGKRNVNTHVINTLGIPVFVDGLKDVMVVTSPDGILICNKDDSEALKEYLSNLKK